MSETTDHPAVERGCECTDCGAMSRCTHDDAPVAFLVERDGERLRVCTRCDLSDDTKLETLVDADTPAGPYMDYDPLGAITLSGEFNESKSDREDSGP